MRFLLLVSLVACSESDPRLIVASISPADGQTSVVPTQPLRVTGDFALPPGYPADVILVVDAEAGGIVPGVVSAEADELRFEPDEPWLIDRQYLWTIREPLPESRQPEVLIPPGLLGTTVFETTGDPRVLGAVRDGAEICAVVSRPIEGPELGGLRFSIDDEPATGDPEVVDISDLFHTRDAGLGAFCVTPNDGIEGSRVRIWWGDQSVTFPLSDDSVESVVERLQRSSSAEVEE